MARHRGLQLALAGGVALLAALSLGVEAWSQAPGGPAPATGAQDAPTPRTADGRPDFSGYWGGGAGGLEALLAGGGAFDGGVRAPVRNGDISNLTNDNVIARRTSDNLPLYKPEYWSKVQELDHTGNKNDPFVHCMPIAPPRIGPPAYIVQQPNQVIFFYRVMFQRNDFRIIPIAPKRTHPLDPDGTWTGDAIAHWDGDTLVVETEGFNDQSWLDAQGYLHGYNLKTTERLRRAGDHLLYDVTVEDPEYLQKPWTLNTQTLALSTRPNTYLEDAQPCSDRDTDHQVGTQREL